VTNAEDRRAIRRLQLQIKKLERMRDGWEGRFYLADSDGEFLLDKPPKPARLTLDTSNPSTYDPETGLKVTVRKARKTPIPTDPPVYDLKGSTMTYEMHWKALTEKIKALKAELEEKKRQKQAGGYVKP